MRRTVHRIHYNDLCQRAIGQTAKYTNLLALADNFGDRLLEDSVGV